MKDEPEDDNAMPVDGEGSKQDESSTEKRRPVRKPSQDLQVYSAAELATFRKRELMADTELFDGKHAFNSMD